MTGELVTIRFRCGLRLSIDTIMEARKLKLCPIPSELGERYDQFQKEFR
jgi:hypothetical protein